MPASTPVPVCDGVGKTSPLSLSQTKAQISVAPATANDIANKAYVDGTPVPVPSTVTTQEAVEKVLSGKYVQQTLVIQQILPNVGYCGGVTVLIQGSGFLSCASITFGGVSVKWKCINSDSIIWCRVPPRLTAGAVDVVIACAANPGQTNPPVTVLSGFTYTKYTNSRIVTPQYINATPSFQQGGPGMAEADNGLIFFASSPTSFGTVGLSGAFAQVQYFTPGNAPTGTTATGLAVIANLQPYHFNDLRFHGIWGLKRGGDGMLWGFDHHSGIIRIVPEDPTEIPKPDSSQFIVERYSLNKTGDQPNTLGTPASFMTGPDGWLYFFSNTLMNGIYYGQVWKVNPFNPKQQQLKQFSGHQFQCADCGVDGLMYIGGIFPLPFITVMDTDLNLIQDITVPLAETFASQAQIQSITIGPDLKFYITLLNFTDATGAAEYLLQLSGTNLATQNSINLPCGYVSEVAVGTDADIWVIGNNGVQFSAFPTIDSVVFQVSPTTFTLLNTIDLTDSTQTPAASTGNVNAIIGANFNGKMYLNVSQNPASTPSRQGLVLEIG